MGPDFFAAIRAKPFGGKLNSKQVEGINAIVEAWVEFGDGDDRKLAYVLATAFHETARTMQPITEYGKKAYFKKYDGRKDLGNIQPDDGYYYRGRGYVQITGRRNYTDWAKRLGLGLVGQPELALDPKVAGQIAVEGMMKGTFTGKALSAYIAAKTDFKNARRVINGLDRAALIAGYAESFLAALEVDE